MPNYSPEDYLPGDPFSTSYRYVRDKAKSAVTSLYDTEHPYNKTTPTGLDTSLIPAPPSLERQLKSSGYADQHPLSGFETPRREAAPKIPAPVPTAAPVPVQGVKPPDSPGNTPLASMPGNYEPIVKRSSSFTDWWRNLGEDKQSALQMAGISMGLNLMAQPASRYPVSPAEAFGKAGLEGMKTYAATMDSSQKASLANREYGLKEKELGLKVQEAINGKVPQTLEGLITQKVHNKEMTFEKAQEVLSKFTKKGESTALQKDSEFIASRLNIPITDAINRLMDRKTTSDSDLFDKIYSEAYRSSYKDSPEEKMQEAREVATKAVEVRGEIFRSRGLKIDKPYDSPGLQPMLSAETPSGLPISTKYAPRATSGTGATGTPPAGFTPTGNTKNGKPVYVSLDGKTYWMP